MVSVKMDMEIFEGNPGQLVFTHNIELFKSETYKRTGQFIIWSMSNGGPGIPALSRHTFDSFQKYSLHGCVFLC